MIGNALQLALREIRNNLLRAGLTTLGIVIGVAAVILMMTLGAGAGMRVTGEFASLGTNLLTIFPEAGEGSPSAVAPFDMSLVEKIQREIPDISMVVPELSEQGVLVYGNRKRNSQIYGTTNAYLESRNWPLVAGREFSSAELAGGKAVCLLGETDRHDLFGDQLPIGSRIRIKKITCEVIGLLQPKGASIFGEDMDDLVLLPLKAVQRRVAGSDEISGIHVLVDRPENVLHVKYLVQQLMREARHVVSGQPDNFYVEDLREVSRTYSTVTFVLTAFLSAVAAVSLLVGGIGIMNIMLVSVTERTREIGIRLAIGARTRDVLLQFLIEAIVMSALGGMLGVVVGLGSSAAIAALTNIPFVFQPGVAVLAVTFAALVGVAFGYFPARRAAYLDPIEALRHE